MKKIILTTIFTLSFFTISNAQYLNFLNTVSGSGSVDLKSLICRVGFGGSSCNTSLNTGNSNISVSIDRSAQNSKKEKDNLALWKTVGNLVGAIIQTAQGKKVEPIFKDEETDSIEKNVYLDGSGYKEDEHVDEETSDEYTNVGEYKGDSEGAGTESNGSENTQSGDNTGSGMMGGGMGGSGGLTGGLGSMFNGGGAQNGGGSGLLGNISEQLNGDASVAPLDPNFKIPENISAECKQNYGLIPQGSCPNVEWLHTKVKLTAMQACTVIGKKIISNSQYRSPACNAARGGAKNSSHMSGLALDLHVNNLSSEEKRKIFQVFKAAGFNNIGCYRRGSGNVHLDLRAGGPRRWGPDYTRASYRPSNCPPELIVTFGN